MSDDMTRLAMNDEERGSARQNALVRMRSVDTKRRLTDLIAAVPRHRVAVRHAGASVSYGELLDRVQRVRLHLKALGVRPGEVVAVRMVRSPWLVAAFLALEEIDAVYLPIERSWSDARADQIVCESRAVHVLDDEEVPDHLMSSADAVAAAKRGRPSVLANAQRYVIFTSGSTGVPKGAIIEHRGMMNHIEAKIEVLGLGPKDRVAFTAPIAFDIAIWQMFAPLVVGGVLVVADEGTVRFPRRLATLLRDEGVTVVELVPVVADRLAEEASRSAVLALRWLLVTGEELRVTLADKLLTNLPRVRTVNAYGPTECSDDVTHHIVGPADVARGRVPIGGPISNVALYVLVEDGVGLWRAAQGNEVGQLFVGGVAVGPGYLGCPDLTRASYFADDLDSTSETGRLYRTGDLVKREGDVLLYHGRVDRQVKVAGVRVELDEIQAVLSQHPLVKDCAVVLGDSGRIAAAIVGTATIAELREYALKWLPAAVVPATWQAVTAVPRGPNGKEDLQAVRALFWAEVSDTSHS